MDEAVRVEKQPKVWGTTEALVKAPKMQLHRITFEKGGVCSEHSHASRYNLFYVLSGELIVRIWVDGVPLESVLHAHEYIAAEPGDRHQFEGLTSGVALEIYWPGDWSEVVLDMDILRYTEGFMR